MSPIPVTLISGFLGSGKTSFLKNVLLNREGIRVAVIVNEITDENIDAYALGGTKLLKQQEQLVELSNGCICCTLRGDLLKQLREIAGSGDFDYILIESSGISEPMQVAQTFFTDLQDGLGPLNEVARLDTCVTIVDATTMMDRLRDEVKPDKPLAAGLDTGNYSKKEVGADGNPQNIGTLMAEQIEYANVVILNKIDRFPSSQSQEEKDAVIKQLTSTVKQLNPYATVVPTKFSKIDLQEVLGTKKCTQEFSESIRGWMTDLPETHTPETEEYGVRNFVFRSERPFHPLRLHQWISSMYEVEEMMEDKTEDDESMDDSDSDDSDSDDSDDSEKARKKLSLKIQKPKIDPAVLRKNRITRYGGEIFRCKGFVWLGNPSRLGFFVTISAAGDIMSFLPGGGWGTFPIRGGTGTTQMQPCQRLAFLGQYLDKERMQKDLEACLLTKEEEQSLKQAMIAAAKKNNNVATGGSGSEEPPADIFDDPFEPFGSGEEEGHDHKH